MDSTQNIEAQISLPAELYEALERRAQNLSSSVEQEIVRFLTVSIDSELEAV
jgi:hypothetical protein